MIRELVKDIDPGTSILDKEGELLYKLVLKYCPENCKIVEIGSWKGRSTIWLAKAAQIKKGLVYAVDPHKGMEGKTDSTSFEEFRTNIKRAGVEDIVVLVRLSSEEALGYELIPRLVDFVFIDGDHSIEAVNFDFCNWSLRTKLDSGIVALHDTIGYTGPKNLISKILWLWGSYGPVGIAGQVVALKVRDKFSNSKNRLWFFYWKLYSLLFLTVHYLIPKRIKEVIKKW